MEFALKSEIYCFIHPHSLLRIVFVHNIYYIFAKLSLANIRLRFSNKPIVHSRHRGICTQKFKNNHFTFLKNTELRLFNRKESQSNSPVQLSSPAVQSNCPVQLSSPTVQSSPVHVLYYAVKHNHSSSQDRHFILFWPLLPPGSLASQITFLEPFLPPKFLEVNSAAMY